MRSPYHQTPAEIADKKTRQIIRRAEASKANMLQVPGKDIYESQREKGQGQIFTASDLFHSVVVDESYTMIGRHLDESIKRRIQEGEFVDFSRLLPRDRILAINDSHLQLFNNNGKPELRFVTESETIGSFSKWEQAFRIFSTIYTDKFPERAKQLLQYNHIIFSAALTYVWSNIYEYDIDFRLHMSDNPGRNWGIILQQAWTLHMKENIWNSGGRSVGSGGQGNSSNNNPGMNSRKSVGKNCWKYNRGKCTYGFGCKFEHRCGICNKFGHGAHIYRKGQGNSGDKESDRERRNNKNGEQHKEFQRRR